jgi:hypothetical protein
MGLLIRLKSPVLEGGTALKSLKYGKDRPGEGDSSQPYVQTPIDQPVSFSDEDTILRGGLKAPSSALKDVSRLTKYFFDNKNPDGLLFIAKQNILSRISTKTEASGIFFNEGIYSPLSTLTQAGVGFTGTHLNKQILGIKKYQDTVFENNKEENNGNDGEVPLSLIRKSQRSIYKIQEKTQKKIDQQNKTNAELNKKPLQLSIPIKDNNVQQLEQQINSFLEKWDKYKDNTSQKKLKKKENSLQQENIRYNNLSNQASIEAAKIRYDNRLLKLWNDSGLNLNGAFSSISPVLYSYGGGPDSILGIGKTNIKFATTNDGVTPSRTNNLPFEDFTRPEVKYSTINIFGDTNNSVSLKYLNEKVSTNDEIFGEDYTLDLYNNTSREDLGLSHTEYLKVFNPSTFDNVNSDIYINSNRPLTKYDTFSIFRYRTNNSVSLKYYTRNSGSISENSLFGSPSIITNGSTDSFFEINNKKSIIDLSHTEYLKEFNPLTSDTFNSTIHLNSNRPLTEYDTFSIFRYRTNNSVSLKYISELSSSNIFPSTQNQIEKKIFSNTDETPSKFFSNNQSKSSLGLPFNNIGPTYNAIGSSDSLNSNYSTYNQKFFTYQTSTPENTSTKEDFREKLLINNGYEKSFLSYSPDYTKYNMEQRIGLGRINDPGKKGNRSNYVTGKTSLKGSKLGPVDIINALPIYKSDSASTSEYLQNDLIRFRIGIIDNDTPSKKFYMHFRAFIDDFSDSYKAQWETQKYMGRGEKFYKYGGFDRDINMSFTVVALSKDELIPMYKKLNYLVSSLAPKYSTNGYMGGNMAEITLGSWIKDQPGIITSINLTVPDDSPWEIAIPINSSQSGVGQNFSDKDMKELPHMVKVKLSFTPIHRFRPEINSISGMTPSKEQELPEDKNKYGKQNYINYT